MSELIDDPRLTPGPDSPLWLTAMGDADLAAERYLVDLEYSAFLDKKTQLGGESGFEPLWIPASAFDFQKALIAWAIRKGKAAIFADCGLGKTLMQLAWAENVVRHTNRPVLVITPLAVGSQTIREGEKFGIECKRAAIGQVHPGINVINYERLHHFEPSNYSGVVLDESSILKSFDGSYRSEITEFMRKMPYRLLCTATAAPNDYIELGTSAEALGELGHLDMLNRFFKNDQNTIQPMRRHLIGNNFRDPAPMVEKWRFKGHAEKHFWRWVCSWARAVRRPSDLGFDDRNFILPELREKQHLVLSRTLADGMLFSVPAVGLKEQRSERKRTIVERCEKAAELANTGQAALIWCHLNPEGDLMEKLIKDSVQVSGSDSDDAKEEKFLAFTSGQAKQLITKPKIGAWGLNFQHCNHVISFPSHSFEQYYQGIRRCWRFGQTRTVTSDIVTTEGELSVMDNLQRKSAAADKMFSALVSEMANALVIQRSAHGTQRIEVPAWV